MKTQSIITILLTTLAAAPTAVLGATFAAFPSPLTCPTASGTSTWTTTELQDLVVAAIKSGKSPFEKSAANIASGRCSAIKLPYYVTTIGKGALSMTFVYDASKDAYEYCSASTVDMNGDGFPESC